MNWTQPRALKSAFILTSGDDVLATLAFCSWYGSTAIAETAEGNWTFRRSGFWPPRVTVRRAGEETPIAEFRGRMGFSRCGELEVAGGGRILAVSNFWMSEYRFEDESEQPVVSYHRVCGLMRLGGEVEVSPAAAARPELPWLIPLGWYLIAMNQRDAAVVAAT
jgi:hypothetical protein